jgi:MFS family permease
MLHGLGSYRPVLLAALFLTVSQGLMNTILSVRLAQMQAPAQVAGLITTAYFLGQVVGSRLGHRLLGQSGHIRAFATVMAIGSICALLIPIIPEPLAWVAIRFIAGISLVLAFLVLESWLNMMAGNEVRGSVFGVYITIVYLGMTAGQALLGVLDITSFHAFSLAAMALMLAVLPMTLTQRAQPQLLPEARLRLVDLLRLSPVGMAGAMASGGLTGAIFGLFPFFATEQGLSAAGIATFMSAVIGGGLLLNWPLGRLSDSIDRRYVIALAAGAIALTSAVLGLGGGGLLTLVWAGGILGGATAALYSLAVAHTNDNAGGVDAIAVGAGLLLVFGLGAIAGPMLAAFAMDLVATSALFAFTGAVGGGLCLLSLWRIAIRQPVLDADKASFVALSGAAASPSAVDPVAVAGAGDHMMATAPGNERS